MLCFDPTRGIDIRTKHQIYVLLRDLAEAGAAVLLYTSELKEIQLVCDRAIVIFGGRVVARDRRRRRRRAGAPAGRLQPEDRTRSMPEEIAGRGRRRGRRSRRAGGRRRRPTRTAPERTMSAASGTSTPTRARPVGRARGVGAAQRVDARPARVPRRPARLHEAHPAELRRDRHPGPGDLGPAAGPGRRGPGDRGHLGRDRPLDRLDDGARQASSRPSLMQDQSEEFGVVVVIGMLLLGLVLGAINGSLIVVTRVPDIVVTLAMSFVWAGCALLVLPTPGGGSAKWLHELVLGLARQRVDPEGGRRPARRRRRRSGSRSGARGSACPSTRSAATGWRRSGAASSVGRTQDPAPTR